MKQLLASTENERVNFNLFIYMMKRNRMWTVKRNLVEPFQQTVEEEIEYKIERDEQKVSDGMSRATAGTSDGGSLLYTPSLPPTQVVSLIIFLHNFKRSVSHTRTLAANVLLLIRFYFLLITYLIYHLICFTVFNIHSPRKL